MIPKINSAHGSDTRNIINRAIEVLNKQGKAMQDLVAEGQLTEEQYAELITVINGLIKSGHVDKGDLTSEFKDEIEGFSAQLAQKATKGEIQKVDYDLSKNSNLWNINDFDEATRKTFLEAQGISVDYVLGNGNVKRENISANAVGLEHVSFLNKNENILNESNAIILDGALSQQTMGIISSNQNAFIYLIEVKPNKIYSIKPTTNVNWDRTRYAIFTGTPVIGYLPTTILLNDDTHRDGFTFDTMGDDGNRQLALFLNSSGEDVPFEIVETDNIALLSDNIGIGTNEYFKNFQDLLGGRNLLLKSGNPLTTATPFFHYDTTEPLQFGETYTISFEATMGEGRNNFVIYMDGKPVSLTTIRKNNSGKYNLTFTITRDDIARWDRISIVQNPTNLSSDSTIYRAKLEKGNTKTPYSKPPEEYNVVTQKDVNDFIVSRWNSHSAEDDKVYVESFRYGNKSDTEIIQDAFDTANNDIVVFGSGREYMIDTTVIAQGSKVKGIEGNNATLLGNVETGYTIEYIGSKTSGSANPRSITEQEFRELNSYIRDLRITSATKYVSKGLRMTGFGGFNFENLHIFRTYDALTIDGIVRNLNIVGSNIYDNANTGIFFDRVNLHQINIGTTHVSYNKNGIRFVNGNIANVQISGCDLENNAGGGFSVPESILSLEWDGDESVYPIYEAIVITGNTIQEHMSNSKPMINIDSRAGGNQDIIISSNLIGNSGADSVPIYVNNAEGLSISDNNIVSSNSTPGFIHSIVLEGVVRWSRINGNTLESPIKHDNANITHTIAANNACRDFDMPDGTIGGIKFINNVY